MAPSKLTENASSRHPGRMSLAPTIVAFVVVAAGFVLAAVYGELRASAIDEDAAALEKNALPSVEHLAAARSALYRVELAVHACVEESGEERREAELTLAAARADVDRELNAEFSTELYPGEAPLQADVRRSIDELDRILAHVHELEAIVGTAGAPSIATIEREVRGGVERAEAGVARVMALNAAEGHAEAARIAVVRAGSVKLMFGLDVACVALAAALAFVTLRSLRRQRDLELAHDDLLEVRAAELERFASRVAHDLLSPLSALSFTLSSLRRNAERGLSIAAPLESARACLKRSQSLVDGVMDFARSGGPPTGGRASLRATVDGVLDEARAGAEGVALSFEALDEDVFVACSAGVLASILSNLVRNAVKYVDGRPEQKVTVRALETSTVVRVEVEDTGPGLPKGLEAHVFEPYVRSPDTAKPGLGLGLATVQRFVESHRGRLGVDSAEGKGCVFWFELPRAPGDAAEVLHSVAT